VQFLLSFLLLSDVPGARVVDGVDRQHLERVLLDRGSVSEAGGATSPIL
jgi:hypothetical protein